MKPQILIGAASSGSGKTTFTLGLLRALKNRGLKVQPFKCGPDYIDTKYHSLAANQESVNLDTYLASDTHLHHLYQTYGADNDVCVTEGVMGLFDGYDGMKGSSAEIGQKLNIPIVLILNAKSMAYSVAPILYGYKHFHNETKIAGVIFNMVSSEGHFNYLLGACKDVGMECFGYLPKEEGVIIPSRHLGLTLDQNFRFDSFADKVADFVERNIDIDRLLKATTVDFSNKPISIKPIDSIKIKIAVARDEAFNFMYRENIAQLQRLGNVEFFSPLADNRLPLDIDLLYLPGGYPELFLQQLSANQTMINSIQNYVDAYGKVIAECGGMMYLCKSITGMDGKTHPMVGVLPQEATMENMRLSLGYRRFTYNNQEVRGHEFHYSKIVQENNGMLSDTTLYNAVNMQVKTPLYRYKNVIAGYTHIYWGEMNILNLWYKN